MQYFNVYRKFTAERIATVFCETRMEAVVAASEALNISRRHLDCSEMEYGEDYRVPRNRVGDYVRMPDGVLCKRVT